MGLRSSTLETDNCRCGHRGCPHVLGVRPWLGSWPAMAKAASLADATEFLAYWTAAEVDDAGRQNSFPGYLARVKTRMDKA
jgi:hypothetical protein